MRWFFGILLLVAGIAVAAVMLRDVMWQDNAIRHFTPVDAHVLSSEVQVHHGNKSNTYTPLVSYRYHVGGSTFKSSQLTPYSESGSSWWAYRLAKRFKEGADVKAYVNPQKPAEAILVREYSSTPYIGACWAIAVAALGAGILFIGGSRTTMQAILLDTAGWQLLLPAKSVKRRLRDNCLLFLATGLPMGVLLGHLVTVARGLEVSTWIFIAAAAAVIVGEITAVYRAQRVAREMSDPRVMVRPAPLSLGQPFGIRVELDAYVPLSVQKARARLVCTEHYKETSAGKTRMGTRVRGENVIELGGPSDVPAGQMFSGENAVEVGGDRWLPSNDEEIHKTHPYFTWELRLEVELLKRVDYRGVFPLVAVEGPANATTADNPESAL